MANKQGVASRPPKWTNKKLKRCAQNFPIFPWIMFFLVALLLCHGSVKNSGSTCSEVRYTRRGPCLKPQRRRSTQQVSVAKQGCPSLATEGLSSRLDSFIVWLWLICPGIARHRNAQLRPPQTSHWTLWESIVPFANGTIGIAFLGKCLDQSEKWNDGSIARSKYQRESMDGMNPSIPRIGLAKSAGNPGNPDVSKKNMVFPNGFPSNPIKIFASTFSTNPLNSSKMRPKPFP